jgi:Gpi18-like mannosyltransferase
MFHSFSTQVFVKTMRREWWLAALLLGAALLLMAAYRQPRAAQLSAALPPAALPQQGFHAVERLGVDERGMAFRWSEGEARLSLPNPGYGPLRLRIWLAAPPAGRTTPVELRRGAWSTPAFLVSDQPRRYSLLLPPERAAERVELLLETNTFREDLGRSKERRLGVMVASLEVAAPQGGGTPANLLLLLLAACAASYALLRRAAWPSAAAALALLAGAGALALAQAGWAWRWGLSGRLLALIALGALAALALDLWLGREARDARPAPSPHARDARPAPSPKGRDGLALGLVLLGALLIRVPWVTAPDPVGDLELSVRRAATLAAEGLAGAYAGSGGNDYLPLRLYLLWGLGRLAGALGLALDTPLAPASAWLMKLPWLLADLATVALLYAWSRRHLGTRGAAAVALGYAAMPQVWLNPAWWGQVDALLVLLMLAGLLLLVRAAGRGGAGYIGAWLVLGLALLVKMQAIILLPLVALLTLRVWRARGLVRALGVLGATLGLGMLPLLLAGQAPGLIEAYLGSVGRFNGVTINAYNIWYFVAPGAYVPDTEPWALGLSYRQAGLALLGLATLLIALLALRRTGDEGQDGYWPEVWLEAAAIQALAFFLLPTQIHERYMFLCFAFLAARLATAPGLWPIFLLLGTSATINIFGTLDFWPAARAYLGAPAIGYGLAALNLIVFAGLLIHLHSTRQRYRLRGDLLNA